MKNSFIFAIIGAILVLYASSVSHAEEKQTQIYLGAGMVISSDYRSFLNDVYPDADMFGGFGFLEFSAGVRFNASDQLSLTPTLGLLLNYVTVDGTHIDESYLNSVILPSLALRYRFSDIPSFYAGGELNYGIPHSGSDYYDFDPGGIGYGVLFGYTFVGGWSIETGYRYVPVDIVHYKTKNLGGGLILRFGKTF